jgi:hypothetical protein
VAAAPIDKLAEKEISMRKPAPAGAGMLCAVLVFAPPASADPDPGHVVTVTTPVPPMRCAVDSDDSDQRGPAVVCQAAGFPQAPMDPVPYPGWHGDPSVLHQDQAIITKSGQFAWRTANLGMAPPDRPDVALVEGQTYHFEGWTILPTRNRSTFTNDATGHGMVIGGDYSVSPF